MFRQQVALSFVFLSVVKSGSAMDIHICYDARICAEVITRSTPLLSSSPPSSSSSSASATGSSPGWYLMTFISANCRGVLLSSDRFLDGVIVRFIFFGSAFHDA